MLASSRLLQRSSWIHRKQTMHLILDFDGTITANDTLDALARAAIALHEEQGGLDSHYWTGRWSTIVNAYVADYKDHVRRYQPSEENRTSLDQELVFLRSLHDLDQKSLHRLRDARLFSGLTTDTLVEAGRKAVGDRPSSAVHLRPGIAAFLQQASEQQNWPVSILSVNWSDAWIRGVIESCHEPNSGKFRIFANKIEDSGDIVPNFERTGNNTDAIGISSDKLEAMKVAGRALGTESEESVVYIGDSTTDLECLLEANTEGIIMAGDSPENSSLLKTLARLQYKVPHVSESAKFEAPSIQQHSQRSHRLAWARNFDEILASGILGSG